MRGVMVAVALFQAAVLEKLAEKDRALGREIFDLKDEQVFVPAYLLLNGSMIGLILSLVLLHLYYGSKALNESPFLSTIVLTAGCIAIVIWLFQKFHYGPKLRKLEADFQQRLKDPEFKRVSEEMVTIGKKIQPRFHL